MKLLNIFLLLFVAISGNAKELIPSIKIIQPLDNSRYIGKNATFVIEASSEQVDTIVITQDDNKTTTLKITAEKQTYCKTINLHVAQNTITISSFKAGKLLDIFEREFYFLSELFEGADEDDSLDYELRYFHSDEKEERCKSCHNMKSNIPTDGNPFEDVSKTSCYDCHKGMINTRNTHAPAANWLCVDCHNGKYGEFNMQDEGKSKYLAPNPMAKTCASCHDEVQEWDMNKYRHGPLGDGRCERCHNPHGSDNKFFLRKNIWDLCVTCHSDHASGKHVISSIGFGPTITGGHPTKNKKDPSRPGRELSCSSCHNPHGSQGTKMLRMKGSMAFGVCQRCHKK